MGNLDEGVDREEVVVLVEEGVVGALIEE